MGAPPPGPHHLPKPSPPTTITLGGSFQHMNFGWRGRVRWDRVGGHTNTQTRALPASVLLRAMPTSCPLSRLQLGLANGTSWQVPPGGCVFYKIPATLDMLAVTGKDTGFGNHCLLHPSVPLGWGGGSGRSLLFALPYYPLWVVSFSHHLPYLPE